MPGLRIRCVQFLTLVVLAAYALAQTQPECACQCPELDSDLCTFIKDQNVIVKTNEGQVKQYHNIMHQSETFLKDAESQITKVVNHLVEAHINSVLKTAVANVTATANPEGSAGTNVTLNKDSPLQRTHDYLTRVFKAMKDLSSELKEMANRTKNRRVEEEDDGKKWSDEREQLLKRLDDLENSTSASKEELSRKIQKLEETDREQRKELSDLRSDLRFLETLISDSGSGNENDSATVQSGEKCTDGAYREYCKQIVEAKFCSSEYYRGLCCASCTKSGQLPPN